MDWTNSLVLALPPKSAVVTPLERVSLQQLSIKVACLCKPGLEEEEEICIFIGMHYGLKLYEIDEFIP